MYAMMADLSELQTKIGKGKAEEAHAHKKAALEEFQKALDKQREAEEGGFLSKLHLGDIAKVAAIAVSVAAVAVTGGASLAVAGALLSAGAFAVEKTKCFGEASQWVALGMSVAGGVGTAWSVAGQGAAAATTVDATASTSADASAAAASAAAGSAGAAGAAAGSAAATAGTQAAAQVAAKAATQTFFWVALGAETGIHLLLGGEKIETAVYGHEADMAHREATTVQYEIARLDRLVDHVIEQLKDAKQGKQHGNERLTEIKETEAQTLLIAAGARA